jgi:cell fate regulator YaaT (PSP1 superfamily)
MACSNCGTVKDGKPGGCQSNGGCSTGGCNRMNTYDWLATMDVRDNDGFDLVEVSFKNGSRKSFFHNPPHTRAIIGDMVVVEAATGYDVGHISLTGELVRLQMKKKRIADDATLQNVLRVANQRDIEKLHEARSMEREIMIKARIISRTLELDMKIGDVEFQGDKRKATFYYTAEGRVDFRELIRQFAKDFRVKIEMRQIGARQESARIGGLGSCGRELCCSTWLTDFKSVSTAAARYQNLAINQSKLSGQCGRLKCCLNYELDSYMDALTHFPKNAETLKTEVGKAVLIKTDIFKGLMFYIYTDVKRKGKFYSLTLDRVKEIQALNKKGQFPSDLVDLNSLIIEEEEADYGADDLVGVIELPPEERKKRKNRRNKPRGRGGDNRGGGNAGRGDKTPPKNTGNSKNTGSPKKSTNTNEGTAPKKSTPENKNKGGNRNRNKNRNRNRNNNRKDDGGNNGPKKE